MWTETEQISFRKSCSYTFYDFSVTSVWDNCMVPYLLASKRAIRCTGFCSSPAQIHRSQQIKPADEQLCSWYLLCKSWAGTKACTPDSSPEELVGHPLFRIIRRCVTLIHLLKSHLLLKQEWEDGGDTPTCGIGPWSTHWGRCHPWLANAH